MTARLASSILDMNSKKIINVGTPTAASTNAARKIDVEDAYTAAISRANHVDTQLANTISNFDTQVRTSRLDQMAAPTNPVGFNNQRLTSVADPSSAQDAATRNYVDTAVAGLVSGQQAKGSVRVSVDSNVNLSSPGANLDGIAMNNGEVALLYGQSTGAQNGPYVWNGPSVGMTRAANWDSSGEAVLGSYWIVREGTRADSFALMLNDTFTLSTDTLLLGHTPITPSAGVPFEQDCGDGSATTFTLTHNFGTKAVIVVAYRNASPYDETTVAVMRPTTNSVVVEPDDVWSSSQFHVAVKKM